MEEIKITLEEFQKQTFKKIIVLSELCSTAEDRGKNIGRVVAHYNYMTDFGKSFPTTMEEFKQKCSYFETIEGLLVDKTGEYHKGE